MAAKSSSRVKLILVLILVCGAVGCLYLYFAGNRSARTAREADGANFQKAGQEARQGFEKGKELVKEGLDKTREAALVGLEKGKEATKEGLEKTQEAATDFKKGWYQGGKK